MTTPFRLRMATLAEELADLAVEHTALASSAEESRRRDDAFLNLGMAQAYAAASLNIIAATKEEP